MEILTVKLRENGYLLNGNIYVPNAEGNSSYRAIQEWIAEGNVPEPQYTDAELFDIAKRNATQRVKDGFRDAMENGTFTSTTLGIEIDNRRSATHNDKDNLQVVINLAQYPIAWIGVTTTADIGDEATALAVRSEMELDGLAKYQNKWDKEALIANATTIDELDLIVW